MAVKIEGNILDRLDAIAALANSNFPSCKTELQISATGEQHGTITVQAWVLRDIVAAYRQSIQSSAKAA